MSDSVLVIDLDGTLIRTDTFHEMLIKGLRSDPFLLFKVGVWLLVHDRAHAKELLVKRVSLDPQTLPYNTDLLEVIKKAKGAGSRLVLATGTHYLLAQKIADFIGLFDEVIATYDHINMTGENKARELVARYGEKGFIYAGDSRIDAKVWSHAREAWVVNPKWKVESLAVQTVGAEHTRFFPRMVSRPSAFLGALQVGSWVTFGLLFSILVEMGVVKWDLGLLLFVSLCFVDSGLSLCNLVVNIEKGRAPSVLKTPGMMDPCFRRDDSGVKRREINNPFAKGYLHLLTGLLWGPLFILVGFTLSFLCLSYVMKNIAV